MKYSEVRDDNDETDDNIPYVHELHDELGNYTSCFITDDRSNPSVVIEIHVQGLGSLDGSNSDEKINELRDKILEAINK